MKVSRRTFTALLGGTVPALAMPMPSAPAELRLLEAVTVRVRALAPGVRSNGLMQIAERWESAGHLARAGALRAEGRNDLEDCLSFDRVFVLAIAGASALANGDPAGQDDLTQAVDFARRLPVGDERGQMHRLILGVLQQYAEIGRPTALAVIEALENEDARRAAVTLARCATRFAALGARDEAAAFARRILASERVVADDHYLGSALAAAAELGVSGAEISTVAVETIRRALESPRHYVLPRSVVRIGRHDLVLPLVTRRPETYWHIAAWAAVADAVEPRPSTSDFHAVLEAASSLSNDDDRPRAVGHVLGLLPVFDPGEGRLIRAALDRVASLGPQEIAVVCRACVEAAKQIDPRSRVAILARVREIVSARLAGSTSDASVLLQPLAQSIVVLAEMRERDEIRSCVTTLDRAPSIAGKGSYDLLTARMAAAHALFAIGEAADAMAILEPTLERALSELEGRNLVDLLDQMRMCVPCLSPERRLGLIDRVLAGDMSRYQHQVLALLVDAV